MSERFWNKQSKKYDKSAKDNAYQLNIDRTSKYLKKQHVVLDFACATGLYTIPFAKKVKEIQAFDTSSEMIKIAASLSFEEGIKNVTFTQTTLFDQKYEKNGFNVLLAFNILLYFKDPDPVLYRIGEVLKKDGILVTTTACLKEKRSLAAFFSGMVIFILRTFRILPYLKFYSMKMIEKKIESSGFKIIETEVLIDTPATEYYIVAQKVG